MISRKQLKLEIDSVDDTHIEILHRIIQELKIPSSTNVNTSISSELNPLKDSIIFDNDTISPIDVSWDTEENRSINQQLLVILEKIIKLHNLPQPDLIEQIDRRREKMAARVGIMPDSSELLRVDRER